MRQIIHAVRGWITGSTRKGRSSAIVYIYPSGKDVQNGELGVNDQIAVLRRLSVFAGKEDLPVTVIFPGRPPRKIPDGTRQNGVEARYATPDQLRKVMTSALNEARKDRSPVLATNHPELEKIARSERIKHIRASTFEEALDSVCGPLRREQPQQPRRQQQPQQPGQAQPQSQPQTPVAKPQPEQTDAPAQPAEPQAGEPPAAAPKPEPKAEYVPRKLQRYEPSVKKEIKDQAILDLIDPL